MKNMEDSHQFGAFVFRQLFNTNFETAIFLTANRFRTTLILWHIKKKMMKMFFFTHTAQNYIDTQPQQLILLLLQILFPLQWPFLASSFPLEGHPHNLLVPTPPTQICPCSLWICLRQSCSLFSVPRLGLIVLWLIPLFLPNVVVRSGYGIQFCSMRHKETSRKGFFFFF